MLDQYKTVVRNQFEAALCMLAECLTTCPDDLWDAPIGKYPFWHVAYHTLCFVDLYLSPSNDAWQPRTAPDGNGGLHPRGAQELTDEYPSRRFERAELLTYVDICRAKLAAALTAETAATLAGESGFYWLKFPRAELHLYNLRHVQHHAGALGAVLRRHQLPAEWCATGWRK